MPVKREKKLGFEYKNKKKSLFAYFYLFFLVFILAFPFVMCYIHIIKPFRYIYIANLQPECNGKVLFSQKSCRQIYFYLYKEKVFYAACTEHLYVSEFYYVLSCFAAVIINSSTLFVFISIRTFSK